MSVLMSYDVLIGVTYTFLQLLVFLIIQGEEIDGGYSRFSLH